jgi:hypothetical protein
LVGVPPDRLLGEILRAARADPDLVIDLTHLERLGPSEGELLGGFVQQVASLRGSGEVESITLRAADIEVLASASGRRPDELKEVLGTAHRGAERQDPQAERRS